MLTKNKIYRMCIEGYTDEGNGVGRAEGIAVFVPNTCIGDEVDVKIVKAKKSHCYGVLERLVTPSPDRVEPYCTVAQRCGGCSMAHIGYQAQMEIKRRMVADALKRIGGFSGLEVPPLIGMDPFLPYRNKMVFPIGYDEKGKLVGGFYRNRSHAIVPLSNCPIGEPEAGEYLQTVLAHMRSFQISAYREENHTGLVRRVMIRTAYHTKQSMVVISVNGNKIPHENELVQSLRSVGGQYTIKSVLLNYNRERNNLVLGSQNRVLFGEPAIEDRLCGLTFSISANSFYQVNPIQTERLYQTALDMAGLTGRETVVDLYSGIGTISLCAAQRAAAVYAVEIVAQAVRDAERNAERNGIENVHFFEGDAAAFVEKMLREHVVADVAIVDPPRKGNAPETLDSLLELAPKKIVYVSCNPATLARDAKRLTESGAYRIDAVQPVDMFPGTGHVETVVLMSRVKE